MFEINNMLERFEVEIKFNKSRYQATTSLFQKCIGYGKTEAEALDNLGKSIGTTLGQLSKQSLSKLFSEDSFTEVLIDGASDKKSHRRVYGFEQPTINRKLVGIEPISLDGILKNELEIQPKESEDDFSIQEQIIADTAQFSPNQDGITFGFHISMN